jgi:AcrR family transcriptional regulator
MYLIQLDLDGDGMVLNTPLHDGWKAIKEFRAVFDKLKIQGMTVVALTADYESVYRYYTNEKDRFLRSVEEVYGNRTKIKMTPLLQEAIDKYNVLQYNSDFERIRQFNEYKDRLINRIGINMKLETPEAEAEVMRLNTTLKKQEDSFKDFMKSIDRNDILQKTAVTYSGYELSRIEIDLLTKKNSKFANEGRDIVNPNKLGLTEN